MTVSPIEGVRNSVRSAIGRVAVLTSIVLCISVAAQAEPVMYTLNLVFDDGGQATGYMVLESDSFFRSVPEFAIAVSGGAAPPFVYDPTNSYGVNGYDPIFWGTTLYIAAHRSATCEEERQLLIDPPVPFSPPREEGCGVSRLIVSGGLERVFAPVITVKMNNLHPASRVATVDDDARFTIDVSPAGWTTPLDWYWGVLVNGTLSWVTPSGLSTTPAPLFHGAPVRQTDQYLMQLALPAGTSLTHVVFACDGTRIIAWDHMSAVTSAARK